MLEILLIEDDEVDVMSARRMFHKNYVINPLSVIGSGAEALIWLRERNHRSLMSPENLLILLDFYLPRMNGEEFLSSLRFDPVLGKIPVLLLMQFDREISPKVIDYSNIIGYCEKPLIFSELKQIIEFNYHELSATNER
jgi:CheY-like chemotaxis protein